MKFYFRSVLSDSMQSWMYFDRKDKIKASFAWMPEAALRVIPEVMDSFFFIVGAISGI